MLARWQSWSKPRSLSVPAVRQPAPSPPPTPPRAPVWLFELGVCIFPSLGLHLIDALLTALIVTTNSSSASSPPPPAAATASSSTPAPGSTSSADIAFVFPDWQRGVGVCVYIVVYVCVCGFFTSFDVRARRQIRETAPTASRTSGELASLTCGF